HSQTNQSFQAEVKLALERMVVQRQEAARSTRHGLIFEDVVCEFVGCEAQRLGDLAKRTGSETGLIKNCKVGDSVIELGPESAAPGASVVVEAKEVAGYTLIEAREEIERGRKNRSAQVGLFVFSARLAPSELSATPLVRHGNDVFVTWDPEDAASDLHLRTGLTLARALCIRESRQSDAQAADLEAIDVAILDIEKKSEGLAEIRTW